MIISEFKNEFRFLSNFHPVPGTPFFGSTVEHWFQAAKTSVRKEQDEILAAATPGKAKRLGRKCTMMKNWNNVKVDIMEILLRAKFNPNRNPELHKQLLSTGNIFLEEGNNWNDTFWGICPPGSNNGQNMLGKLLMKIRDEFIGKTL